MPVCSSAAALCHHSTHGKSMKVRAFCFSAPHHLATPHTSNRQAILSRAPTCQQDHAPGHPGWHHYAVLPQHAPPHPLQQDEGSLQHAKPASGLVTLHVYSANTSKQVQHACRAGVCMYILSITLWAGWSGAEASAASRLPLTHMLTLVNGFSQATHPHAEEQQVVAHGAAIAAPAAQGQLPPSPSAAKQGATYNEGRRLRGAWNDVCNIMRCAGWSRACHMACMPSAVCRPSHPQPLMGAPENRLVHDPRRKEAGQQPGQAAPGGECRRWGAWVAHQTPCTPGGACLSSAAAGRAGTALHCHAMPCSRSPALCRRRTFLQTRSLQQLTLRHRLVEHESEG